MSEKDVVMVWTFNEAPAFLRGKHEVSEKDVVMVWSLQ